MSPEQNNEPIQPQTNPMPVQPSEMSAASAPQTMPSAPAQAAAVAPPATGKTSKNPFKHIKRGVSNLFSTNPVPALALVLINVVVTTVLSIIMFKVLSPQLTNLSSSSSFVGVIAKLIGLMAGILIVFALISSFLTQTLNRIVLTGARKQKISLGEAFSFSAQRYLLTLKVAFTIGGIVLVAFALIILALRLSPPLGGLLAFAAVIAALIFGLRLSYIGLVIVDDERPAGVKAAYAKSSLIWGKSAWALVLLGLTLVVILIVLSTALGGYTGTQTTTNYSANYTSGSPTLPTTSPANGQSVVSDIVSALVSVLVVASTSSIYNEAEGAAVGDTVSPVAPRSL